MQATNSDVDFRALLVSAAQQILLQPIRWDPVLAELNARLHALGDNTALRVFPIAAAVERLIHNGLQQQTPSTSSPSISPENKSPVCTSPSRSGPPSETDKIAIVGMSGRFPGAATTDDLWDILRLGIDACKEVPPLRWDSKTHVDPSGRRTNTSRTSLGCWINDPDVFDAPFFGISDQEATRMDPAQRLALMTTYEAMEQAGIVWQHGFAGSFDAPSTRPDRVGVYCGVAGNDWRECNSAQNVDSHFMRASNRAFISGRISEVFKFEGPSVTVDTSSSGSLAPVQMACRSLCSREIDTCVVTGAHISTNPDVHSGFDRAGLISHSGNCKVFDETNDGFCRGEGVVTLVLKRLEDALADHDPILGVISGVATNYDLHPQSRDSEPAHGPTGLITGVLDRSNVDPASVTYVEMGGPHMHAEGVRQVASALGAPAPRSASPLADKRRTTPLYLGSATANIGHGEATSGLSGIIKILLMLRDNVIPPEIGTVKGANLMLQGGLMNTGKTVKWANDAQASPWCERRRALLLDQGTIAPTRSALLLEEPPLQNPRHHRSPAGEHHQMEQNPRARCMIVVSAKSKTSLHHNMANLHAWLMNEAARDRVTLEQISYTTTARRHHHAYRAMFAVSSMQEACEKICAELQESRFRLKSGLDNVAPTTLPSPEDIARPIVFSFSQRDFSTFSSLSYFRKLYEGFSQVRQDVDHFEQIVRLLDLPSVIGALRLRSGDPREPHHCTESFCRYQSTRSNHTIPPLAHVCAQIVISRLWRSWGIDPGAIVTEGDLDVYSALNIAGVLSDAETMHLAGVHTQLRGETGRGGNGGSFLAAELERLDRATSYHQAEIPVLRLVTAEGGVRSANPRLDVLAARGDCNAMFLTRHILHSLESTGFECTSDRASLTRDLVAACRASKDIPDRTIIHFMGPEPPRLLEAIPDVVSGEKTISGSDVRVHNLKSAEGDLSQDRPRICIWSHLTETLRLFYLEGVNLRWDQYHIDLPPSARRVVSTLPPYSWDLKEYWVPYENDWTLLKGGASKSIVAPNLESTTIHNIVEETELIEDGVEKLRLIAEADISRHDLHGIVQGHVVDGVPLCTPVCALIGPNDCILTRQ